MKFGKLHVRLVSLRVEGQATTKTPGLAFDVNGAYSWVLSLGLTSIVRIERLILQVVPGTKLFNGVHLKGVPVTLSGLPYCVV